MAGNLWPGVIYGQLVGPSSLVVVVTELFTSGWSVAKPLPPTLPGHWSLDAGQIAVFALTPIAVRRLINRDS